MSRRNIFVFIIVLLLIELVILSMKHSGEEEVSSAEIKHFGQPSSSETISPSSLVIVEMSDSEQDEADISESNDRQPDQRADTQQIKVSTPSATKPKKLATQVADYKPGVELRYKVKTGDTLLDLAKKYHTTMYKIRKLNKLSNADLVKVGQKLKIIPAQPSHYRIRRGDSMATIAKLFDVDEDEILRINKLRDGRSIWVGQKLLVPIAQAKIDGLLTMIDQKKHEKIERKKQYQRKLLARLARQKMERKRQKKLEQKKKKKDAKAKKEKLARMEKARRAFKYTPQAKFKHRIRVAATAYTSHRSQTDSTPFLAAWNNRIRPGMKIIAVSPDLIRKYGITNGVRVKIGGLPGTYVVRDKMNARLHDHIDIYMGTNRKRALRWGHRYVVMYY